LAHDDTPKVPNVPGAQQAPAPSSSTSTTLPFITGGGGFAIGLFTVFGMKELIAGTQTALAMTVFGLLTCLILVMAISTMDMRTIPGKAGKPFAIGVLAAGIMAAVMLTVGLAGASMFISDYWAHPQLPVEAYYSLIQVEATDPGTGNKSGSLLLLVNGQQNDVSDTLDQKKQIEIQRNAIVEVRIPLSSLQKAVHDKTKSLAKGAPPQI
jgi:hypothetical protein